MYGLKGALCETDFRPKFRNLRSEEERNEDLHSSVTKDLKASRIQRQKASNAWKADRNCVGASAEVFSLLKKVKKYKSSNISACKRPTGNLNPFLESLFRAHCNSTTDKTKSPVAFDGPPLKKNNNLAKIQKLIKVKVKT